MKKCENGRACETALPFFYAVKEMIAFRFRTLALEI